MASLRKASPERLRLVLRVMDWLAAPFGTTEYLQTRFGSRGTGYTLVGPDPVSTDRGKAEALPVYYIANGGDVLYDSVRPEDTEKLHQVFSAAVPTGVMNAANGLYSPSTFTTGPRINAEINDLTLQIMQGRADASEWAAAARRWRQGGGDTIRAEYEAARARG